MSNWKRKRYYIDRSEGDTLIFITSGRKNVFVRSPEMWATELVDERTISFVRVKYQEEHPLSGMNCTIVEDELTDLKECGLDTSYRFFWKHCVQSRAAYPSYNTLFRNLDYQIN